jgi:uncharacterized RDD family membrane protein YckC
MQWYYALDGQRSRPVPQDEFERLIHTGTIQMDTLVWRQGMPTWQTLAEVLAAQPELVKRVEGQPPALPASDEVEAGAGEAVKRVPMVYAGFWVRVLARFIDGFILWIVGQIFIGVIGTVFFATTMAVLASNKGKVLTLEQLLAMMGFFSMVIVVSLCCGLIYDWYFMRKYDATPGKLAMGLRVYRADGTRLSTGRIIGRHFAHMLNGFTLGVGYLMAAFDAEKRGLHDHVCDTRVVKKP